MLLGRGLAPPPPGNCSTTRLSFANDVVSALTPILTRTRQTYIHTQCFPTGRSYVCAELRTHAARRDFIIMEILLWRVTYRKLLVFVLLGLLPGYCSSVSATCFCRAHLHVFDVFVLECGQIHIA